MKLSICHYSLHRSWNDGGWGATRLAEEARTLGLGAIDFHAGLLGDPEKAPDSIAQALEKTGLQLSGLSLSTNFNRPDPDEMKTEIENACKWIDVAAKVGAPVSRIFGGHIKDRTDKAELDGAFDRMLVALREVTAYAEKAGVILAIENHGGLPCTGDEQVKVIKAVNSPNLRATVDIGNYMQGGEEGIDGTKKAAALAAYVHIKDFKKIPSDKNAWGWGIEACTIGEGDVDVAGCLKALDESGYGGFVALEYEGLEDESVGVPKSLGFINSIINQQK